MIRILFFHPDGHPTFRPDVSVLFGKYMASSDVVIDVVTHATGQPTNAAEWQGSTIHISQGGRLRQTLHAVRKALSLPFRNYDAIMSRDMPIVAWLVMLRAALARRTFFYWRSFPIAPMDLAILKRNWKQIGWIRRMWLALKGGVGTLLERLMIGNSLPAHIFVQSKAMAREVEGWGAKPAKVTAVPMCIDPERFPEPGERALHITPQIIYVGACDRSRGVDVLVETIEELRRRGKDVMLSIVGDAAEPADKQWLRSIIAESPAVDSINFTGWVSMAEVDRHLSLADAAICLMPVDAIYGTTTPTKLVEYMASAIPVIVNDHPDQTEVIAASGGGIISPLDASALADGVESLVGKGRDAIDMGVAGRAFVLAHRNYVRMAEDVADVIRNAISR